MKERLYGKPDEYVTLYCKAASHAGRPWIVATYIRAVSMDGSLVYWRPSPDQWLGGVFVRRSTDRHDPTRVVVPDEAGELVPVDNDSPEGTRARIAADQAGTTVYTTRLRCHRCGDTIRRSGENLQKDLDAAAVLIAGSDRDALTLDEFRRVGRLRR